MMKLSGEILASTALKINWKMPVSFFFLPSSPRLFHAPALVSREICGEVSREEIGVPEKREIHSLATIFCYYFPGRLPAFPGGCWLLI